VNTTLTTLQAAGATAERALWDRQFTEFTVEKRLRKEEEKEERRRRKEEEERLRKEAKAAANKAEPKSTGSRDGFENNLRRLQAERARPGPRPPGLVFGSVGDSLGDEVGRLLCTSQLLRSGARVVWERLSQVEAGVLEITTDTKPDGHMRRKTEERGITRFLQKQDGSKMHGVMDKLARRTCSLLQRPSPKGTWSKWVPESFDDYLMQQTNHRTLEGEDDANSDRALCFKALLYANDSDSKQHGCPLHQDWTHR
jgi:hypothetical protein